MAKVKITAAVTLQEQLAADIYDMRIKAPEIAESAVPGQFVSLYSKDGARILPRPISLCGIDKEKGELRLVYRIAGEGTKEFSGLTAGDTIDVLGPLGNGFPLEAGKKAFLIGGGIGVPPMLELAKALHELNKDEEDNLVQSVLGYRDSQMFLKDEFEAYGPVYAATEAPEQVDGERGHGGRQLRNQRKCAGRYPRAGPYGGCHLRLRSHSHAPRAEGICGRKGAGVLAFPGREDGLRSRRLSGLCVPVQRGG